MHPEDCYLHGPDRINHSQLSEGTRFAALMGLPSMQVYAAGSLYLLNGQIIGIDSRTGHYYWSFDGKDQEDINAALDFTVLLGYNKLSVLQWGDLTEFLSDMW
jgi:hypothetical protein